MFIMAKHNSSQFLLNKNIVTTRVGFLKTLYIKKKKRILFCMFLTLLKLSFPKKQGLRAPDARVYVPVFSFPASSSFGVHGLFWAVPGG